MVTRNGVNCDDWKNSCSSWAISDNFFTRSDGDDLVVGLSDKGSVSVSRWLSSD